MRASTLVLGAVSGLLFGFFVGLDLFMFKVIQSDNMLILLLPILGLVAGLVLAMLKRKPARPILPST